MTTVRIAAIQCALPDDPDAAIARVADLVRNAARDGAQVVLPPELFSGHYFPREQRDDAFDRAHPVDADPAVARCRDLAAAFGVVIPVSFFERAGQAFYNSVALIDAGGALLGVYRKSHIPDGPGYQEKYFFRPGDTGFRAWRTAYGFIGVGICWDQWFPECARAMALLGADVLLYPTAIGSEPAAPDLDTRDMWRRVMIGHAVANMVPIAAANRVGDESGQRFYGSSFVCDHTGAIAAELSRDAEGIAIATVDLAAARRDRASFGFFRDRRPELYRILTTADGSQEVP
ncbi:MAG: N-carbamoylputrescine amidase [Deltaproteobacteria bacterium]|nr:MAG: N-carbamoylputrescine amidase [Deltaproteobacteria bacterium]